MPQTVRKGPLPPEEASINYAACLYGRLRCRRGWRTDASALLGREYARFWRSAGATSFGVLSMWEYARLVEATDQYLRHKGSESFSRWFYVQVCANLGGIHELTEEVPFDEREEESMGRALKRVVPILRSWKAQEKARE